MRIRNRILACALSAGLIISSVPAPAMAAAADTSAAAVAEETGENKESQQAATGSSGTTDGTGQNTGDDKKEETQAGTESATPGQDGNSKGSEGPSSGSKEEPVRETGKDTKTDPGTEKEDKDISVSAVYGDGEISLSDKVKEEGYDNVSYSVANGKDVISVSDDGKAKICAAGSATVKAEADKGTLTFKITVAKKDLGLLEADDISWDKTEKEEDGTDAIELTGKVKESAGIEDGDAISVKAVAKTKSSEAGTWGSELSQTEFTGNDNYDLSMSVNGPDITIIKKTQDPADDPGTENPGEGGSGTGSQEEGGEGTGEDPQGKEASVTGSYDNNSAKNGKYFNKNRTLTLKVDGEGFDEADLSIHVFVDGDSGDYTVAQLQTGSVESVAVDRGENSYNITFGGGDEEEHSYSVKASYNGKDVKLSGTAAENFIIDKKAPELDTGFKNSAGGTFTPEEGNTVSSYHDDSVIVTIEARDIYFKESATKVTVKAVDSEGKTIQGAYSGADGPARGTWANEGAKNTFEMEEFTKDANYTISIEAEDLAGNKTSYGEHSFGIDREAPEVTLSVKTKNTQTYDSLSEENNFGLATDKAVHVIADAKDSASGIKNTKYYIYTPPVIQTGEFSSLSEKDLQKVKWEDLPTAGVTLENDSQSVVYVRAEDKAGHVSYANTKDVVIVDGTDPKVDIAIVGEEQDIYKGNVTIRVNGEEPVEGETYSGLVSVTVEVSKNGAATDIFQYTPGTAEDRVKEFTQDIVVNAGKNSSNNVLVKIYAKDAAGNTATAQKELSIDATEPEITAEFINKDIRNGHYLNETAELEVTIKERNFDPEKTFLQFAIDNEEKSYSMKDLSDKKALREQVIIKEMDDSEEDVEFKDLTDERTITYILQLGTEADADIDYTKLKVTCEDTAGNKAETSPDPEKITVDKVAPAYVVTYREGSKDVTSRVGTSDNAPYYTQDSVTVSLGVRERNFAPWTAKAYVTSEDHDGSDNGAYPEKNYEDVTEGWNRDGSMNTKRLPVFEKDSNYGIRFIVEDLAGNKADAYPFHYFTVDKTAPSGRVTVHSSDGDKTYSGYSGSARFDSVSRDTITVTRTASDKTSGVASVRYYKYTPSSSATGRFSAMSLDQLRNADWKDWDGEVTVRPDSQAVVYARIADRAGNILYISTDGAMIADRTQPWNPDITISAKAASGDVYGGNVPASISVGDPVAGGTYSGLKKVTIDVLNGSSTTQSYTYHPGTKEERIRTFGASLTVDAQKNNSNHVTIRVTAEDHAGNISSAEKQIAIDITDPVIEVSYDKNDPVNGRYYNTVRTATITVKERNFDPSRANISVSAGAKVSSWRTGPQAGASDSNVSTCTIVYGTDGDYTFTMTVTDKAGNRASYGKTDSFTIDMTKPVIRVTYNVNRENGFYNTVRTATVHVTEKNFNAKDFEARVQATLLGQGIKAPSISGWSGSGEEHTAQIVFDADGDYEFTLNYTDLASNKAQGYSQGKFVIDRTAPEVTILGVKDKSANRGTVEPVIRYTDIHIGDNAATIKLKGNSHIERTVMGGLEAIENGGQVTLEDFAHTVTEDDVYTLTVSVADRAGNVAEKTIVFSINRFGSNFYFDKATADIIQTYYVQEAGDIVIYEVNVDNIKERSFTLYRDGKIIPLPDGLIKVNEEKEGNGWKKYCYVINKKAVKEEGHYELIISTTDEAGNKQENRTKDAPVSFVVDRTPPSATITGIEEGETYYSTNRDIEVRAMDNCALEKVDILVNGEVVKTFSGKELDELEGVIPFSIEESEDWKTISAVAYDAAGNASKEAPVKVLITSDKMTRFMNSPAPFIFVCIIAVIAGLAVILARKLAARDEDEDSDYYG